MAAKQVIVSLEQLPLSMLPSDWSMAVKLDWQDKTNGLVETGEVANFASTEAEEQKLRNDDQDITLSQHDQRIINVTNTATQNTLNIQQNANNIATNTTNIETNETNIQTNAQAIGNVDTKIDSHIASNVQHGATGDIVGNQDYAQLSIGGVVNLSQNVNELSLATRFVDDAPTNYDQAQIQTLVDAIRQLNDNNTFIVNKINELIQAQIAAKQMSSAS